MNFSFFEKKVMYDVIPKRTLIEKQNGTHFEASFLMCVYVCVCVGGRLAWVQNCVLAPFAIFVALCR